MFLYSKSRSCNNILEIPPFVSKPQHVKKVKHNSISKVDKEECRIIEL